MRGGVDTGGETADYRDTPRGEPCSQLLRLIEALGCRLPGTDDGDRRRVALIASRRAGRVPAGADGSSGGSTGTPGRGRRSSGSRRAPTARDLPRPVCMSSVGGTSNSVPWAGSAPAAAVRTLPSSSSCSVTVDQTTFGRRSQATRAACSSRVIEHQSIRTNSCSHESAYRGVNGYSPRAAVPLRSTDSKCSTCSAPTPPIRRTAGPDSQPSCGPCPGPGRIRTDQAAEDRRLTGTGPRGRTRQVPSQDHNTAMGSPDLARGPPDHRWIRLARSPEGWPQRGSQYHGGRCAAAESRAPTRP